MGTSTRIRVSVKDSRSIAERLLDRFLATRCPYCGMRDRQPATHLERVHDGGAA